MLSNFFNIEEIWFSRQRKCTLSDQTLRFGDCTYFNYEYHGVHISFLRDQKEAFFYFKSSKAVEHSNIIYLKSFCRRRHIICVSLENDRMCLSLC